MFKRESESIKGLCAKTLPKINNCKFNLEISKGNSLMKLNSENTQYTGFFFFSLFQRLNLKFVNRIFLESHMMADTASSCFVRNFPHVEEASELINYSCGAIYLSSLPYHTRIL